VSARRRVRPAEEAASGPSAPAWPDGYEGVAIEEFLGIQYRRVTSNSVGGLVQYTHWHHHVRQREWGVTDPEAPVGAVLQ